MSRATLSIAPSFVPSNVNQAVFPTPPLPNIPEYMSRNPTWSQTFGVSADKQNPNYFALNEGYQRTKNGMFNPVTGREPVYGTIEYDLNPLDQNQTNVVVNDVYKVTRVQQTNNPYKLMFRNPSQYPTRRGRPDKTNYPASSFYRN